VGRLQGLRVTLVLSVLKDLEPPRTLVGLTVEVLLVVWPYLVRTRRELSQRDRADGQIIGRLIRLRAAEQHQNAGIRKASANSALGTNLRRWRSGTSSPMLRPSRVTVNGCPL
jgi:hypothetical protein